MTTVALEASDLDLISSESTLSVTRSLFVEGRTYVHRIVTKLAFLDDVTLRGRTSVDFTLPMAALTLYTETSDSGDADPEGTSTPSDAMKSSIVRRAGEQFFIPIAVVPRGKLSDLDIVDESGRSLPALNIGAERQLTYTLFMMGWSEILAKSVDSFDTTAPPAKQTYELIYSVDQSARQRAIKELEDYQKSGPGQSVEWTIEQTEAIDLIVKQCRLFRNNAVMFAILQGPQLISRRILKISYNLPANARSRLRLFLERAGIVATQSLLFDQPVDGTRSYHLEMIAPAGLRFIRAELVTFADNDRQVKLDKLSRIGSDRAHLYASERPPETYGHAVHAEINMRVTPGPWLRFAFLAGLMATCLLALTFSLLEQIHTADSGGLIGGAMVVLIGIPPLFLARPGFNFIGKRLLTGTRTALSLLGVIGLLSAWELLVHPAVTDSDPATRVHPVRLASQDWPGTMGPNLFEWRWRLLAATVVLTILIALNFVPWILARTWPVIRAALLSIKNWHGWRYFSSGSKAERMEAARSRGNVIS